MIRAPDLPDADAVVIIGAGLAGASCARALREKGSRASITIIGAEPHQPYDRPPLSKAILLGNHAPALTILIGAEEAQSLDIGMQLGVAAVRIDREARAVILANGTTISYRHLLIATGARPRTLSILAEAGDRVQMLRRYEDALALRENLRDGAKLLIIGGGLIGLEVAAAAVQMGCAVTLVEAGDRLLARAVPQAIAERVLVRHQDAGVRIMLSTIVVGCKPHSNGVGISLSNCAEERFDRVLVAIGVEPEIALAAASRLPVDDGVLTGPDRRTDDPAVFAAGDCSARRGPRDGGSPRRLECWKAALDDGAIVARAILGEPLEPEAPPWFWSDQHDWQIQGTGHGAHAHTLIERRLGDDAMIIFGLDAEDRLVAAWGLGQAGQIGREIRAAQLLIAAKACTNGALLADPGVRLRDLLRQTGASNVTAQDGAS